MAHALTADTGDAGVFGVGHIVTYQMGWILRPQPNRDVGIDAQVETILSGKESGRLLGLQIKAGSSWFSERAPDGTGWVFRENTQQHRDYWLRYQLPVVLVLYDPEAHVAYWQQVTEENAVVTGKGFKVVVPESQRLDATAKPALAALARTAPADGLAKLLDGLPGACIARLQALDEHDPVNARLLAVSMVDGRVEPAETVEQIMNEARPDWSWVAWAAVGEFASHYGQPRAAAECFVRAGEAQPEGQPGRWLSYAGLLLASMDPPQARSLLSRASGLPGGQLLAAIGLAALDHGEAPGPVPIPEIVAEDGERVESDATIQRFLADQAARAGDRATAISYHEQALRLAPDSIGQQLALAEALLQGESMPATAGRMADYRRAANLASAARAATRRCLLDSSRAAELLMQALTMAGDDEAAARVATAAPDGEATPEEAAAPALAFPSARAAYERGDLARAEHFAAVVAASGDPVWTTQLDAIVAEHEGMDDPERERRWRAVVAAPVNPGQRVWALSQLAGLGCWPLAELDTMAGDKLLAPGMYDMLHARALAAHGHHLRALALLRSHLPKTSLVAEDYARLLNSLGRIDECAAACDQASQRFGETRLDLFSMDVLTRAGRADEALTRAKEFLARADLPLHLRHHVRAKLFDAYHQRRDWASCERLMTAGIGEIAHLEEDLKSGRVDPLTLPASAGEDLAEYRRGYAWRLIGTQFNQGDADRALATMDTYQPAIVSAPEAGAWVDLQRLRGWTSNTAAQALQLATRPDLPPLLVGRILFSLLQSVPAPGRTDAGQARDATHPLDALPPQFHDQLRDQWTAFMRTLEPQAVRPLPGDDEELLAQLREVLEPGATRQAIALEAVWQGQAPVGAVSTAAERPYLLSLAERRARILPAATLDLDAYQRERDCAQAALGNRIAVETTALYLCGALLHRWDSVSVEFSEILLAEPTARDILHSHIAARAMANVAGYLGLDPTSGILHVSGATDSDMAEIIQRTAIVHAAAQNCRVTSISDLSAIGSRNPIEHVGAYLAPIAVAVEQGLPLYTDDAVLRAAARSRGVACFGTLALIDVLATEHDHATDPADLLRVLFTHHVVDLHQAAGIILHHLADRHLVDDAVLVGLARPATWQPYHQQPAELITTILVQAYEHDASAFREVVAATATGCTGAFHDPETVLAMVAAIALAYVLDLTPEGVATVLPTVKSIGASYGIDPTSKTSEMLVGILTDPEDRFQFSQTDAEQRIKSALANA